MRLHVLKNPVSVDFFFNLDQSLRFYRGWRNKARPDSEQFELTFRVAL